MRETEFYAGFWARLVAFFIDVCIVSILVFPFVFVVGSLSPGIIVVEPPFGLFTTKQILSKNTENVEHGDGSVTVRETKKIRKTVLDKWVYAYEVTTEKMGNQQETTTTLIDADTGYPIEKTTSSDIEFYAIFIYWVLLEASGMQGSVGKRIMKMHVVNSSGFRPSIFESAGRNLLKIVSGLTIFIGFMMAGWTKKKQALHDKIPNMYVVKNV